MFDTLNYAGNYYYRVAAVDSSGNNSVYSKVKTIEISAEAPLAPPSGKVSKHKDGYIFIEWGKSPTENIAGYFILAVGRTYNRCGLFRKFSDSFG